MRLFESLLLITLVVLVYQTVYSRKRQEQPYHILFFAIITVLVHLMVEGYRWQMIPAYLSFGFIYLRIKIGVLSITNKIHKITWLLWTLLAIIQPYIVPVIELPDPDGPHFIGSRAFHWIDSSRTEWFTPESDSDFRELVVQVWYPASSEDGDPLPYLNDLDKRKEEIAGAGDMPSFLVGHIDLTKTHSYENAPVLYGTHPVLFLSHGITGYRQLHTSLIENLASNGYIVIAPDHTYDCNLTVFPNGKIADYRSDITGHPDSVRIRRQQLNTRVADIRFIMDKILSTPDLEHHIDTGKMGVLGHSYGGATAIQTAFEDPRIKAALTLDSWMNPLPDHIIETGIQQPFLYIGRPHWNDSEYPNSPTRLTNFRKNLVRDSHHYILEGSLHLDFCDAPLFSPLSDLFLETGNIPAKKAVFLVNTTVKSFFDKYLINAPNDFPNNLDIYPELLKQ